MTLASASTLRGAPRALFCALLLLGLAPAAGCYKTEATNVTDEAKAAAEALTRSLSFTDGRLEDGELPATDDEEVRLLPLESEVVIEPGSASVMSLTQDNPAGSEDPITAALLQFGEADQHFEVEIDQEAGSGTIRHMFSVDDDVCSKLCNKRFTIPVRERARTRSGKIGQTAMRDVQLECTNRGSSKFCAKRPSSSGNLEERILDKLDSCGLLARRGDLNELEELPCAWECLAEGTCSDVNALFCNGESTVSPDLASCFAANCSVADTQFHCDNGNTIDLFLQCDDSDDCGDNSDERSCGGAEFSCGDGETVSMSWVCDQYEDCLNGHDEDGCAVLSCGGSEPVGPGGSGGSGGSGGGSDTAGVGGMGGSGGSGGGGSDDGEIVGASCSDDDDCPSGVCAFPVAGSGAGFCSVMCRDTAECPMLGGITQLTCVEGVCNLSAN